MYIKKRLSISSMLLLGFWFTSCNYGINQNTTQIAYINNRCLSSYAWDSIKMLYSINEIKDSLFANALTEFKSVSFPVSLIYFKQEPQEIIGFDYSSVRYVYNPTIDSQILDGLSLKLNGKEKKRIRNRIQQILIHYQCEEGKKEAIELMKK